jgi:transposase InsO family protein
MHADLMEDGIIAGRHRIARLMRDNDLKARQKRRFKKTTDSNHGGPVAPNHLDQDFAAIAPDQKWVETLFKTIKSEGTQVAFIKNACARARERYGFASASGS